VNQTENANSHLSSEKPEERPFGAPWEAQAFAMAVRLNEAGLFTWSEWTEQLGAAIRARPSAGYYENWLTALEAILETKNVLRHDERLQRITAWEEAARNTPHGQPIVLKRHPGSEV
jgi:nitrile hydratase accessory protein